MKLKELLCILGFTLGATLSTQAQFFGCTNPLACNYSSTAVFNDGSCCLNNCYTLVITSGSDPSEVSWEFRDSRGGVYGTGGTGTYNLCLQTSCYSLFMYDSGGDGWEGGTYSLIESNGDVVSSGTLSNGYQSNANLNLTAFCLFNIYGCTIPSACNYNPSATFLDPATCEFPGCTDPSACNYYNGAGCDDGSCTYDEDACSGYCTNLVGVRPGFVNGYEPDQWNTIAEGTGSAYHTPSNLLLIGSNNSNGAFGDLETEVSTTIDTDGFYSFTWEYQTIDSPADDPAYYKINGTETIVTFGTNNSQTSTNTFYANAGDTFTFGIRAEGDAGGNAWFMVHNFRAAAVPCGCTDPAASNFDPAALGDDGSCCYDNFFHLIVFQPSANLGEASWSILESDNTVYFEGSGGFNGDICLPDGCFIMTMTDNNADGWEGGYWRVEDQDGNLLNQGGQLSEFLYTTETFLVLGEAGAGCLLEGCMDPLACNYRPNASVPSEDCCYEGCVTMVCDNPFGVIIDDLNTDEQIDLWENNCPSYLPDNNSETVYFRKFCLPEEGCFDMTVVSQQWNATESTTATIYWEDGTWLNSFLILPFEQPITHKLKPNGYCVGCMNPMACNYSADFESTSYWTTCRFPDCADPQAENYNPEACEADNTLCHYLPYDCTLGLLSGTDPNLNSGFTGVWGNYPNTNSISDTFWSYYPYLETAVSAGFDSKGVVCNSSGGTAAVPVLARYGKPYVNYTGQVSFNCHVNIGNGSGDVASIIVDDEYFPLSEGTQVMTFDIENGDAFILEIKRTVSGGPGSGIGSSSIFISHFEWEREENCGCMHELACNYDPMATSNWYSPFQGPCVPANGCGDQSALNFNPESNCPISDCTFVNECGQFVNLNGDFVGIPDAINPTLWTFDSGSGNNETTINEKTVSFTLAEYPGAPDDECSATVVVTEDVSLSFKWSEPLANIGYFIGLEPFPEFKSFYEVNGTRTYLKASVLSDAFPLPQGEISLDLNAGDEFKVGVAYSENTSERIDFSSYDFELILSDWSTSTPGSPCAEGCTYTQASNFDPTASIDDGTCVFAAGTCPGDFDGSMEISSSDLLIFLTNFGEVCN